MLRITDYSGAFAVVASGTLIVAGILAFWATKRWGWRAWPLLLCEALLVPVLAYTATALVIYLTDALFGLAGGFVVHAHWLILIVPLPILAGARIGWIARRHSANGSNSEGPAPE